MMPAGDNNYAGLGIAIWLGLVYDQLTSNISRRTQSDTEAPSYYPPSC